MKIRTIALAGVAALALTGPALADDPGWYLGLAAGYDNLTPVHYRFPASITNPHPTDVQLGFNDNVIGLGSFGYKFESGMRLELEFGYDQHTAKSPNAGFTNAFGPGGDPLVKGGESTTSGLINFVYDFDLGGGWGLSAGGGVGFAAVNEYIYNPPPNNYKVASGAHDVFEWQGIAGIRYAIADNLELFGDYRYRSAEIDGDFASPSNPFSTVPVPHGGPVHIFRNGENVGLLGIRWYLGSAPPPPPPPPPPAPPPPPPPPVKTFIVFFDFDKSNLTAEAQSVVSEAVKTAKETGMVKVMVTGHTDTVGSDRYNQALSVRRAESVKDEMQRQGMDGGSISIEGKSFHDPLVPTGPGVREPQNRRAVIDLGG